MRQTAIASLLVVVLLAASARAYGQPAPPLGGAETDLAAVAERAAGTVWYGMYVQDQKIGHLRMSLDKLPVDGRVSFRAAVQGEIHFEAEGARSTIRIREVSIYEATAPFRLVAYESDQEGLAEEGVVKVRGAAGPKGFELTFDTAGKRRQEVVSQPKHDLSQSLATLRLLASRPKPGTEYRYWTFDPSDDTAREEEVKAKVLSVEPTVRNGVPTDIYKVEEVFKDYSVVSRYLGDGTALEGTIGPFVIRLEDEAIAKDHGAALSTEALFVKLAKPLGKEPGDVKRLVLIVSGLPDAVAALDAAPRQRVAKLPDGRYEVTLEVDAEPAAGEHTHQGPLPDEVKKALEATRELQADDPKIVATAKEVCEDASHAFAKVERINRWVFRNIEKTLRGNQASALHVLEALKGDCTEHTALFVALARAAGVPAREAGGLMYTGDEGQAFGYHAWPEVWVEGRWIAVDPTWDEPIADATHLKLGDARSERGFIEALGRIQIEVKEVR